MLTDDEQFVADVLGRIGITAQKIAEARARTADLMASDGEHRYVIEVKTRTDDDRLATQIASADIVYRRWPVGPTSTVAAILQQAMAQIDATSEDELRLIWICVRSFRHGEYTLAEQIRQTLYGISRIAGSEDDAAPECYFFFESVFFRHKQLDGAVITFDDKLVLGINPYGGRSDILKQSKLGRAFQSVILDPIELERDKRCLIADCDIDRSRSDLVLEYLGGKYNIRHPVHFNFDEHAAFARISADANQGELEIIDEDDIDGLVVVDD